MKIFLLEDNPTDAELTIRSLKKAWPQCSVEHVSSVKEAQKLLEENPLFDIALLDMQLPDGNGLDILMEIRQKKLDMAVAMLTGSGDEEVAVAALKAGADDYTVKQPGYTAKVPQSVELALENHRQYRKQESSAIHVLYIEHNAADVDFTRRHLTRYAPFIRLTNVPNGEKAMELLPGNGVPSEKWDYQLVLMDYRLPGMNALEIIKEIRLERKLDIPILIVTGHGNEDVAVQALKVGASDYLVKRENYLTRLPLHITGAHQNCELKRKQKALAESESKYRLLAENSGDVIFTLDFDLNFTYVSPAVYKLRGFTVDEVLQQNIAETLTPGSLEKVKQLLDEMLPGAISGTQYPKRTVIELQTFKKDNSLIWVEVTATLLTNDIGNPIGILGVTRDISKRKAAQDELRKLSRAVEQSPVSITITNADGDIEYVNPQFTKLTGYDPDEVMGKNPRILKSGKNPDSFYKKLWETILSGKNWQGEFQNKKKNGELYWVSASISPLFNSEGNITHFVAVKEDITERKKIFEDLKIAKESAEAADRLKTAFLNNISHEVRTPLNGILGFGEMLLNPNLTETDKEVGLGILQKSSKRLINTITDFMDISLIVSRNVKVNKKLFNINEVLQFLYEEYVAEANEKGMELRLASGNSKIETDPVLLKKILSHLLVNAIKFSEVGEIKFGYEANKREVEFFVCDKGVGIGEEKINSIFDFFTQGEVGLTRGYEGSGLGLSIAKGFVELLGGKIDLQSEKGKGTEVTFTLPAENISEPQMNNSKAKEKQSGGNIVLIAEDDEMNRLYVETILKKVRVETLSVTNGKEAVKVCRQNPDIALVFMDIKMPVLGGLEATRQIKLFKPGLRVIAITAQAMQGDKQKALDAGCDDYIAKPFDKEKLISMINNYMVM